MNLWQFLKDNPSLLETKIGDNNAEIAAIVTGLSTSKALNVFVDGGTISNTSFAATQGTSPWVVSGSVTASGTVTSNQGTAAALSSAWPVKVTDGSLILTLDPDGTLADSSHSLLKDDIVASRRNQIEINFSTAFDTNLITNTVSGSGAAAQANGKATFATGTTTSGEAKGVSTQTMLYRPGHESYAYFTASFTTPTHASSFQRIGLYDTNNGFFLGYEGTSFKVTVRQNGVDTGVAIASWNGDHLTGAAASTFTRARSPEAIDWTKLNIFRIIYSWFGAAPIKFEVFSPDGVWVTMHTIFQPNTATSPSVFSTSLPLTVDVSKTSADTTNLIIGTACWAAGTTDPGILMTDAISDYSIAPLNRSVLVGHTTAAGGAYVNVKVNPSGTLTVDASNSTGLTGTVTANAGTNLNTSALALETGGNLATIAGYLTPKAIKTVTGAISATTTIVNAVTSKRIKVVAFSLITASTTAVTVTFKSDAGGTALWTVPMQAITGTNFGVNLACSAPSFLFATAAGKLLEMSMSTAQTVTYSLSYFDDDAT